ncbi:unnamed protein product [Spodoptera exigua]|nr:unnamed protein product [Spodoptera exigua]
MAAIMTLWNQPYVNSRGCEAAPLYVRYTPSCTPAPADRMPLRLSAVKDSNCRFTTTPLLPCDRLEGLGTPVKLFLFNKNVVDVEDYVYYKLNIFLDQMKKGGLMLARFRKMSENLNSPTILTQSSGSISFGSKISLYAPHVPCFCERCVVFQPLYVRYDPDPVPGLCGLFPLYLSKYNVANTRWRVLPVQRPDITRFEQEGTPVLVNQDVVINHCSTNRNLGINLGHWALGFFGKVCAPMLKTCLDVYGRELPNNVWQIHTPIATSTNETST